MNNTEMTMSQEKEQEGLFGNDKPKAMCVGGNTHTK